MPILFEFSSSPVEIGDGSLVRNDVQNVTTAHRNNNTRKTKSGERLREPIRAMFLVLSLTSRILCKFILIDTVILFREIEKIDRGTVVYTRAHKQKYYCYRIMTLVHTIHTYLHTY